MTRNHKAREGGRRCPSGPVARPEYEKEVEEAGGGRTASQTCSNAAAGVGDDRVDPLGFGHPSTHEWQGRRRATRRSSWRHQSGPERPESTARRGGQRVRVRARGENYGERESLPGGGEMRGERRARG